jgi:hypothetical protein
MRPVLAGGDSVIPRLQIVLTAPQWLVVTMLAFVIAAALFRIGLDLYVTHIRIEDIDQLRDDADKGARGVERHEEELEAIKVYLAARDDADTDEMPAVPTDTATAHPAATANVKIEALRPVPHKREEVA